MKILAVDDERMILEMLETSMEISGNFQVETARSGEQALEILAKDGPDYDCFLLDIQMPGIDGSTLCRAIRDMPQYRLTPIIMTTAMSQKTHIDRAFQAGASDYIMKPFDLTELETRIETACRVAAIRASQSAPLKMHDSMRAVLNDSFVQSLQEPFEVGKIDNMVGYVSFQNYLLTLSIFTLLGTSVRATKIANVQEVFSLATPVEFRTLVSQIGQVVSSAIEGENSIFTYWGNGTFLSLHQSNDKARLAGFETRVLEAAKQLVRRQGWVRSDQKAPRLVVGPTASMMFLNKSSALKRAIDNVEKRCIRAKEVSGVFEQAMEQTGKTEHSLAAQRESYADMLRECLGESTTELRGRV